MSEPSDASGVLLAQWRAGDARAADALFARYADRLIGLARARMPARLNVRVDAEDIVQSVYRSLFRGARAGQYTSERGGDLWRLLVAITLHKVTRQLKRNTADKRDMDRETARGDKAEPWLAREPGPHEAAALTDQVEHLMRRLTPLQRQALELRLQGHNLYEIATQLERCERTVRRALDDVKRQLKERPPD